MPEYFGITFLFVVSSAYDVKSYFEFIFLIPLTKYRHLHSNARNIQIVFYKVFYICMRGWITKSDIHRSCIKNKRSVMSNWSATITLISIGLFQVYVINALNYDMCVDPLGMESGRIKDGDITASSSYDSGNVGPQNSRLRKELHGGAWCPKQQATSDPKEWLEIHLQGVHVITSVATQGRFGNGDGLEYTEAYLLEYWRPRLGKWVRYTDVNGEEIIQGNENTYTEVRRHLNPAILAMNIRFVPYSYHRRTVCLRVEVYGCEWTEGPISYSMPQGDKWGTEWEFFDITYDGYWNEELEKGLGQLTDGKLGVEDMFRHSRNEGEMRNLGWIGWKNETRNGRPVEITFEFDHAREFSLVRVHVNNHFTKDVQIFSKIEMTFSISGRRFSADPITYTPLEDRIFEDSRNISVKLHHRIGRFVKLKLHFSNKWIMISEVQFESDIAQGNFTGDIDEDEILSRTSASDTAHSSNVDNTAQTSTMKEKEQTIYLAIVIGILIAVIMLLGFAIFLIISRYKQRKCFASPLTAKNTITDKHQHLSTESSCGTYSAKDATSSSSSGVGGGAIHRVGHRDATLLMNRTVNVDDYQEPYQALKYAPYYSYSSVIMEMRDALNVSPSVHIDYSYDYAVPELGTMPLLGAERNVAPRPPPVPASKNNTSSSRSTLFSRGRCSDGSRSKKSSNQQEILDALRRRLEQTVVPEFPRHRLRMISKIGEGMFGTVYIAEADGILEYGGSSCLGKRLVGVKFLTQNATEAERIDFHRDVRILAALEDVNIARVLGICTSEEPVCVIMEYLDHGDLNQFLKTHIPAEGSRVPPIGVKTLSFNCLLYMASQIASGMRYLESLNFVHRDLATRNCVVGKAYHVKISDFGAENELYTAEYYRVDSTTVLPIRWMAWESVFLGKYTTKSDVWSFGVTLWEILTLARELPYEDLTDREVMQNLAYLQSGSTLFQCLPRPACSKDIFDLMLECWRKQETERPSFREIHLFLQRKNLGYAPVP